MKPQNNLGNHLQLKVHKHAEKTEQISSIGGDDGRNITMDGQSQEINDEDLVHSDELNQDVDVKKQKSPVSLKRVIQKNNSHQNIDELEQNYQYDGQMEEILKENNIQQYMMSSKQQAQKFKQNPAHQIGQEQLTNDIINADQNTRNKDPRNQFVESPREKQKIVLSSTFFNFIMALFAILQYIFVFEMQEINVKKQSGLDSFKNALEAIQIIAIIVFITSIIRLLHQYLGFQRNSYHHRKSKQSILYIIQMTLETISILSKLGQFISTIVWFSIEQDVHSDYKDEDEAIYYAFFVINIFACITNLILIPVVILQKRNQENLKHSQKTQQQFTNL